MVRQTIFDGTGCADRLLQILLTWVSGGLITCSQDPYLTPVMAYEHHTASDCVTGSDMPWSSCMCSAIPCARLSPDTEPQLTVKI